MYTMNDPVIEASSGLKIAPFNIGWPKLKEQAEAAELDPYENKWELVFDFTNKGEANYEVIPPSEWKTETITIPDDDSPPEMCFDYPKRYGGNLSDEPPKSSAEDGAFDIAKGKSAAEQKFQAYEAANKKAAENEEAKTIAEKPKGFSIDVSNLNKPKETKKEEKAPATSIEV